MYILNNFKNYFELESKNKYSLQHINRIWNGFLREQTEDMD